MTDIAPEPATVDPTARAQRKVEDWPPAPAVDPAPSPVVEPSNVVGSPVPIPGSDLPGVLPPVVDPAPVPVFAPAPVVDPTPAPVVDPTSTPAPDLKPGYVVFFNASVYGEAAPQVYAGVVLFAADGRARVHSLGLAKDSADFPVTDLRLNA